MDKQRPIHRQHSRSPAHVMQSGASLHYERAFAAYQQGQTPKAKAICLKILATNPNYFDAVHLLGAIAHQAGDYPTAAGHFINALSIQPRSAHAHNNLGLAQHASGQFQAALASFSQSIDCAPDYANAYSNRSLTHYALKQFQQAVDDCSAAIALQPNLVDAYNNRGHALISLNRQQEAIADMNAAIAIRPDFALAYYNRAVAQHELLISGPALSNYEKALEINPKHTEAYWNIAVLLLLMGDYVKGWRLFEWRHQQPSYLKNQPLVTQPLWLGEQSLEGKVILLHAEQGLGDTIQFCRYAPLIAAMGARVILAVQAPLVSLLTCMPGEIEVVASGTPVGEFDYHCPLMSLPLAFKTTLDTIPLSKGYLRADANKAAIWEQRLAPFGNMPRIGLVWNGGFRADQPELWRVNERRNIPLSGIAGLNCPGILFVSLQKGNPAEAELLERKEAVWPEHNLFNAVDLLTDFSDTAALIDRLDMVISVDTSTAHLAAAMGKPVWLLNRFDSCWRWMETGTHSPWYDSVRLYRQVKFDTWAPVLQQVREDLLTLVCSTHSPPPPCSTNANAASNTMTLNTEFWNFFNAEAAPLLAHREKTFRQVFTYLDTLPGPVTIVETGCARSAGNWAGDGQSTLLFDRYISCRDQQSSCQTVDISPVSVAECRKLVSPRVQVTQDDSVHYLSLLAQQLAVSGQKIDLLYLDSFDLDLVYWMPSAIHHLKELAAVMRCIGPQTLVVVDDCPLNADFITGENQQINFVGNPNVGGKGRLIAEFAQACGAKVMFAEYQAGWTGF